MEFFKVYKGPVISPKLQEKKITNKKNTVSAGINAPFYKNNP
jgi:hypothetical protein